MAPHVRTVLGDFDPASLGRTYSHEHLLTRPAPRLTEDDQDLVLDDEGRAAEELRRFRAAGGGALVECTTAEYGRDARGLRRLSASTGAHVVAVTGHVTAHFWRGVVDVEARSEAELVDEFVGDLIEGFDGTGVRAGCIKVGASEGNVTPVERRVMRAAAVAQRITGAPITTHTTAGTAAAEQVRVLERAGADLDHVCVGHLDRRLVWEEHIEVARAGVYLGYDQIGKEQYQPDAERARFVVRLAEAGYGDRVCLGGDMARRSYLEAWGGGPGLASILTRFLPRLLDGGLDQPALERLLVSNPAGHLTWTDARSVR